jgi:hypothetical protein
MLTFLLLVLLAVYIILVMRLSLVEAFCWTGLILLLLWGLSVLMRTPLSS